MEEIGESNDLTGYKLRNKRPVSWYVYWFIIATVILVIIDDILNLHLIKSLFYSKKAEIFPNNQEYIAPWFNPGDKKSSLVCNQDGTIYIRIGYDIYRKPIGIITWPDGGIGITEKSGGTTLIWDLKKGTASPTNDTYGKDYNITTNQDGVQKICEVKWILPTNDLHPDTPALRYESDKVPFEEERFDPQTGKTHLVHSYKFETYTLNFKELGFPDPKEFDW